MLYVASLKYKVPVSMSYCRFVHSPRYKEIHPIISKGEELGEMRTVTVDFSFSGNGLIPYTADVGLSTAPALML